MCHSTFAEWVLHSCYHIWSQTQSSALFLPVVAAPPPVGGAAPGQSTLSRDMEELQEIVGRLATTRGRTRRHASRGVMTGMSPVSGTLPDQPTYVYMALQFIGAHILTVVSCQTVGRLAGTVDTLGVQL